MKTKTTISSKGNTISFKFNTKTAEIRTWIGGEFIYAKLVKIEAANEKLERLLSGGWKTV